MSGSDDDRIPSDHEENSGKTIKKTSGKPPVVVTKKPAVAVAKKPVVVDSDADDDDEDSSDLSLLPARLLPVKAVADKKHSKAVPVEEDEDEDDEDDEEDEDEGEAVDSDSDSMEEDSGKKSKSAVAAVAPAKKPAKETKPKQPTTTDAGDDKKPVKRRSSGNTGSGMIRCPTRYPKSEGWTLVRRPDADAEEAVKSTAKGGPKKLFTSTKHTPDTYVSVWSAKSGSILWTTRAVGQPQKNAKAPSNEKGETLILDHLVWTMPKVQNRFADCKGVVEKFIKGGLTAGDVKMPFPTTFCTWIREGHHTDSGNGGGEEASRGRSSSSAAPAAASSKKSKSPKPMAVDAKSVAAQQAKDLNVDGAPEQDIIARRVFPTADSNQAKMTLDNFFIACASLHEQEQAGFEARTKNLKAFVEKFRVDTSSVFFEDDAGKPIERLYAEWSKKDDFDWIIKSSIPLCILSILSYKEQYTDPLLVELAKLVQEKQAIHHDHDLVLAKLDTANRDLNAMQQQKVTLEQQLHDSKERLTKSQHANAVQQKHAALVAADVVPKSPSGGKLSSLAKTPIVPDEEPVATKGKRRAEAEVPESKKQRASTPESKAAASTPLLTPLASPAPVAAAAAPARSWLAGGLGDDD